MNTIEFIRVEKAGFDFLSIEPATKQIPLWYRKMEPIRLLAADPEYRDFTAKKCIPILDAMTTGYSIKTNYDIHFEWDEDTGKSSFKFDPKNIEQSPQITMHNFEQIRGMELDDYHEFAYKFSNPWVIKTPPGYSCFFTNPINQINPFYVLNGVVDTDVYPLAVQFPFFMKKRFNGTIKKNTTIVQIFPFKRDEWKMSISSVPNKKDIQENQKGADEFNDSRYHENGELAGGLYKKKYRIKKKYL